MKTGYRLAIGIVCAAVMALLAYVYFLYERRKKRRPENIVQHDDRVLPVQEDSQIIGTDLYNHQVTLPMASLPSYDDVEKDCLPSYDEIDLSPPYYSVF